MMSRYKEAGTTIYLLAMNGDRERVAECFESVKATDLLNESIRQNEARHYTRSARAMYQAEQCEGFQWVQS